MRWVLSVLVGTLLVWDTPPAAGYTAPIFLREWVAGCGNYSRATAVDTAGNVFIADAVLNCVRKYDPNGSLLLTFGSTGSGDGQFNQVWGMAASRDGYIYVADTDNSRIQKFDLSGAFVLKWGTAGSGPGQFQGCVGLAVDQQMGFVYVADIGRVQKFSAAGLFRRQWGSVGTGDGQFGFIPYAMTVNELGEILVADADNNRVQVFDGLGNFVRKWGAFGAGPGQFYGPRGIAVDGNGFVYVVDTNNDRVQVFDPVGTYQASWGSRGSLPGEFYEPWGIGITDSENLFVYVADVANHRIQKFGLITSGVPSSTSSIPGRLTATPNPFSDELQILATAQPGDGSGVEIYDVQGRLIRRLQTQSGQGNQAQISWDGQDELGEDSPPGVYFVRSITSSGQITLKVVRQR